MSHVMEHLRCLLLRLAQNAWLLLRLACSAWR